MKYIIQTLSAAAAGAAVMYYLDPDQGKRRRALVRDKVVSASSHTTDTARAQSRRVTNRLQGWAASAVSYLPARRGADTPRKLHDRVRSHLGRAVSHPKAIHVDVMGDGTVRLTGHVLDNELDALLDQVGSAAGVSRVDNQLMVHESAGNVPELQGGGRTRPRGRGRLALWSMLALAAPVAVLAAASRPARPRGLLERLSTRRRSSLELPRLLSPSQRRRRYLSALRAS